MGEFRFTRSNENPIGIDLQLKKAYNLILQKQIGNLKLNVA